MGRVLLSGYYGFGNVGDEAILASTVEALRRKQPDIEIAVLSQNPDETAKAHGVESYPRMAPLKVASAILSSDLVVFGGGSLIQDDTSLRSLLYYLSIIFAARALGKQVVVYANGIGPIRSRLGKALTKAALALVRKITVRDPESETFLRRMGVRRPVRVTADPAFLLSPSPDDRCDEIMREAGIPLDRPLVWLAVRPRKAPDGFYTAVSSAVEMLRSRGYEPCLLVMQETDRQAADSLNGSLADRGQRPMPLISSKGPRDVLALLRKGSLCIGMRLHTLILAASAGVPFMGVEIDPKIGAFCRAAGCPVLPDPRKGGGTDLDLQLRRFVESRDELKRRLAEKIPLFRSLAEDNIDMVLSVLDGLKQDDV